MSSEVGCIHWGHSRSRLDLERTNFVVAPTHGLEGGIVVAELTLTTQEVLTLKDSHTALSVVLGGREKPNNMANSACLYKCDAEKWSA